MCEVGNYRTNPPVLIATAPNHGHGYAAGVLLSVVLAPLCALAVVLGTVWRTRSTRSDTLTS